MADKKSERRGLGRGLSALMADVALDEGISAEKSGPKSDFLIPVEKIRPNPDQPRRTFSEDALKELSESIREKGIIQPLIVRQDPKDPDMFEIVAGERRWRAAQLAQLHELPAIVRSLDDTEVLEIAIIENIQRADLNAVEEAVGYRQLMDRFGHTQEKLAEALSKSRSYIANLLRLLNLPDDVLQLLRDGKISTGHARALITTSNPSELAAIVVEKGLSVRDTEKLAKHGVQKRELKAPRPRGDKDADTVALEGDLSATLRMRVSVDHETGKENGKVTISYKSLEQLDELCRILSLTN
ncbi:MAG: ParB/RepB/Spo0J family partition protein [Lentilitoribacter sp.]